MLQVVLPSQLHSGLFSAADGNIEIVGKPRSMITIANGLAPTGVPQIEEMLREGNQDSIWNLSDGKQDFMVARGSFKSNHAEL